MNSERTVTADDDSGLVTRFLRGDTTAFDSLFLKYQDYVYNIIFGIVGSAEEARDLTQEVFVQVYRSLPKFRHGSRFATWLYRIAANRAVDATRSSRGWRFLPMPEEPILARFVAAETSPEDAFERGLERDIVQGVLMLCPVHHRQVLALRYFRELSMEDMAEVLECSVAAAKLRLHRARLVFKEHYLASQGAGARERKGERPCGS